jgi:Nuclease-related domain
MAGFHQVVVEQPNPCDVCGDHLGSGSAARLEPVSGGVVCAPCTLTSSPVAVVADPGVPGRSAQREYERRRRLDQKRVRRALPVSLVVLVLLAVSGYVLVQLVAAVVNANVKTHGVTTARPPFPPPTAHFLGIVVAVVVGAAVGRQMWGRRRSTHAWTVGARGERAVAARLARVPGVIVLHDRRVPGSRANIDHIVIGPSGVFVIDDKVVSGGRVSVERRGPIGNPGPARLYIGGWDRTSFVEHMGKQVEVVQRALWADPEAAGVPVRPLVIILGAQWGLLAQPNYVAGAWVGWPRAAARVVGRHGPLSAGMRQRLAEALMEGLPVA